MFVPFHWSSLANDYPINHHIHHRCILQPLYYFSKTFYLELEIKNLIGFLAWLVFAIIDLEKT